MKDSIMQTKFLMLIIFYCSVYMSPAKAGERREFEDFASGIGRTNISGPTRQEVRLIQRVVARVQREQAVRIQEVVDNYLAPARVGDFLNGLAPQAEGEDLFSVPNSVTPARPDTAASRGQFRSAFAELLGNPGLSTMTPAMSNAVAQGFAEEIRASINGQMENFLNELAPQAAGDALFSVPNSGTPARPSAVIRQRFAEEIRASIHGRRIEINGLAPQAEGETLLSVPNKPDKVVSIGNEIDDIITGIEGMNVSRPNSVTPARSDEVASTGKEMDDIVTAIEGMSISSESVQDQA
jgi:hypothetical protein